MKNVISIGDKVEMFIDYYLIDHLNGLCLKQHMPHKMEKVFVIQKPWEDKHTGYYSIFKDGPLIKMYYRGKSDLDDRTENAYTCYAESSDGVDFYRPELGLFEFNNNKKNNIVWNGRESHNFFAFIDNNPHIGPEEKYKAIGGVGYPEDTVNKGAVFALYSNDGITWDRLQDSPIQSDGAFDSLNTVFWDKRTNIYRCYSRYMKKIDDANIATDVNGYIRQIQSTTSEDFIHWNKPVFNTYKPECIFEHYYTNAVCMCPGTDIYMSFPMRFIPDRKTGHSESEGVSDTVFITSRDGCNWERVFPQAWIRPGLDYKNWTHRNNMAAAGIAETSEKEFSIYAGEHNGWDDNGLRRYVIRKYGFASIHAGYVKGEVTTKAFITKGGELHLNYSTSAAGGIKVSVLDINGRTIDGYGVNDMDCIYGDEINSKVTWKSGKNFSHICNKPVKLRIMMEDADLYSLQFK